MRFLLRSFTSALLSMFALGIITMPASAAAPTSGPYVTDPQNAYVNDDTSQGLNTLNMVLCIMGAMDPADMVNKGNYIALIDQTKCDASSQASTSNSTSGASGASSAPDYIHAVVNVSRASNTAAMIVKAWMSMTQQGHLLKVYAYGSATKAPSAAPPYGNFHVDYIGKVSGATAFNGYVDTQGANVSFYESDALGGSTYTTALAMNATSTTAGAGTIEVPNYSSGTSTTFNFAYDSNETSFPSGVFRRFDGTNDECFDRAKTNAEKSVWRYGTYNDADGTRVTELNPGFPISYNDGTTTYNGYASYWGINFQGLDMNSQADGALSGTVSDQRPNKTNTYSLNKVSSRLIKWTQHTGTLASMDGIPFFFHYQFGATDTNDTDNIVNTPVTNPPTINNQNWEMQWNSSTNSFTVIGRQDCSTNGCVVESLQQLTANSSTVESSVTVNTSVFNSVDIQGWSQAFGGNINIPSTGSAHTGTDGMGYFTQSEVVPGSSGAPTTLYCLSNCPTASSFSTFAPAFAANPQTSTSPFDSTTTTQYGFGSKEVTYTFDAGGLKESSTPMSLRTLISDGLTLNTQSNQYLTGTYQYGIMSGRLFTTDLTTVPSCNYTVCEPYAPTTYYTWQTGDGQWSQSLWLTDTSTSTVVSFDPPQNISYTVPSGAAYGTWAGKTIQLQFDGFGNLDGIPGGCVNPVDNSATDCSTNGARYVPAFAIPDGSTMTLTRNNTNTTLIVKALDTELRLKNIPSCTNVSLSKPINPATLPTSSSLHDPSSSGDSEYLGTEPTVTGSASVIQGVVQ